MERFSVLQDYRRRRLAVFQPSSQNIRKPVVNHATISIEDMSPIDGEKIAYLFSLEAEKCLRKITVHQLLAFLKQPYGPAQQQRAYL